MTTRILLLLFLGFASTQLAVFGEPTSDRKKIEFFENLYKVKLEGVKPLEAYHDPDAFYSAIAKQVGIPKKAFGAVEEKFGWKQNEEFFLSAMVKGGSDGDYWGVMVTRFPVALKEAKTMEEKMMFLERMEMKMVVIGYDGAVSFPEDPLVREFGSSKSPDGSKRLEVTQREKDLVDFEVLDSLTGKKLAGDSLGWSAMRWFLHWETPSRLWGYGGDAGYFKLFEFKPDGTVEETAVDQTMPVPPVVLENLPSSLQR